MNFALEAGVKTHWDLSYSNNSIVESDFPNFGLKNVRAYVDN